MPSPLEFHNDLIARKGVDCATGWSLNGQRVRFDIIFQEINVRTTDEPGSILDVGCGTGDFYFYLMDRGYEFSRYTGVDVNRNFLERFKERTYNPRIKLIWADVETFKLTGSYDYVIASGLFCHVTNEREVLKRLWRVCRKKLIANFLNLTAKAPTLRCYSMKELTALMKIIRAHTTIRQDYLPNDRTLVCHRKA